MNTFLRYMVMYGSFLIMAQTVAQDKFELPEPLKFENYKFNKSEDLLDRVQNAPETLIRYLSDMDGVSNYSAHRLNHEEKQIFSRYLGYLPQKLLDCVKEHDINIVFVKHFKGAGMVQYLLSKERKLAAFLIINPKTLRVSLRDWIELRENSPFLQRKGLYLRANLTHEHPAILFTLLHETAHLFDMFHNLTPFVDMDFYKLGMKTKKATKFTQGVWVDYLVPIQTLDFPSRLAARPYGLAQQIDAELIIDIYENLTQTPFISLYSAQAWSEDYAETFTWCYLHTKLNIEYGLTATRHQKVLFDYYPLKRVSVQSKCKTVLDS